MFACASEPLRATEFLYARASCSPNQSPTSQLLSQATAAHRVDRQRRMPSLNGLIFRVTLRDFLSRKNRNGSPCTWSAFRPRHRSRHTLRSRFLSGRAIGISGAARMSEWPLKDAIVTVVLTLAVLEV